MGNRGRFGKYGEIKRLGRLRRARSLLSPQQGSIIGSWVKGFFPERKSRRTLRFRIRQAEIPDRSFIAGLSREVFSVYGPYEDTVTDWFDSGHAVTLVALMQNTPVGFAMLGHLVREKDQIDYYELLAVAVRPDKQHMGIGESLLKEVEKEALRYRVPRLHLHTATGNLPAQGLFMKFGFYPCETKNNFYPQGQDALTYVKELSP